MKYAPDGKDPKPLFLLCLHNKSSPRLHLVQPQNISELLEEAARDYCTRRIIVGSKDVTLPSTFFWYKDELFSPSRTTPHPIMTLPWLSPSQEVALAKLVQNGPLKLTYKYDWVPHPKPMIIK